LSAAHVTSLKLVAPFVITFVEPTMNASVWAAHEPERLPGWIVPIPLLKRAEDQA
jgi:hypothetical protein